MFPYEIPQNVRESLQRYVDHKIEPGSFLRAVLENNLMEAFGRADHINVNYIKQIAGHIYNNLPSRCHGSPDLVNQWLADTE